MYEYKLQIGCLLIIMYFLISYVRATAHDRMKCNHIFDALLIASPWAIIFDGATAWTVNRRDIVPDSVNLILHCLFFLSMSIVNMIVFVYTVDQTIGIRSKRHAIALVTPGSICLLLVVATINKVYYVAGSSTDYSMGVPVVICYMSLLLHSLGTIVILIAHRRTVEKEKLFHIVIFYSLVLAALLIQSCLPESLITSLLPTLSIIGIYICFENPSLRHLHEHNDEMVTGFATLVENRDNSTGGHIKRSRGYVKIILKAMKHNPAYRRMLTEDYIQSIIKAAPMHDIGKISTPDSILQKQGKLTAEEYETMKKHAEIGGEIIKQTFCDMDTPEYQKIAYEVARFHHERWDGTGYPDKLKGEEIPLHARIMAIADVFDAVSAKRCYRDALPIDECRNIISSGSGSQFDPALVEIFMGAIDEVLAYYEAEKDK